MAERTRREQRQDTTLAATRVARATPSDGERTTLRVPSDLLAAADRLASDALITRNAALIELARLGASRLAAERRQERLREQIREAVLGAPEAGADEFPSPAEYAAAILEPRGEQLP